MMVTKSRLPRSPGIGIGVARSNGIELVLRLHPQRMALPKFTGTVPVSNDLDQDAVRPFVPSMVEGFRRQVSPCGDRSSS